MIFQFVELSHEVLLHLVVYECCHRLRKGEPSLVGSEPLQLLIDIHHLRLVRRRSIRGNGCVVVKGWSVGRHKALKTIVDRLANKVDQSVDSMVCILESFLDEEFDPKDIFDVHLLGVS